MFCVGIYPYSDMQVNDETDRGMGVPRAYLCLTPIIIKSRAIPTLVRLIKLPVFPECLSKLSLYQAQVSCMTLAAVSWLWCSGSRMVVSSGTGFV